MEFTDFFLEHWLDDNLNFPVRHTVADIVFADQNLANRAKELIDAAPNRAQRATRLRVYDELASYARRFQDLLERAKDDPPEDTLE